MQYYETFILKFYERNSENCFLEFRKGYLFNFFIRDNRNMIATQIELAISYIITGKYEYIAE